MEYIKFLWLKMCLMIMYMRMQITIVIDDAQTFWSYATSKVKKNDNYYRTM